MTDTDRPSTGWTRTLPMVRIVDVRPNRHRPATVHMAGHRYRRNPVRRAARRFRGDPLADWRGRLVPRHTVHRWLRRTARRAFRIGVWFGLGAALGGYGVLAGLTWLAAWVMGG